MIQKVSKAFKLHSSESCEFLMHQRIKFSAAALHGTVRIKLLGRLDPTLAPYSVVTLPKQWCILTYNIPFGSKSTVCLLKAYIHHCNGKNILHLRPCARGCWNSSMLLGDYCIASFIFKTYPYSMSNYKLWAQACAYLMYIGLHSSKNETEESKSP